jgi:hypothetical protein
MDHQKAAGFLSILRFPFGSSNETIEVRIFCNDILYLHAKPSQAKGNDHSEVWNAD